MNFFSECSFTPNNRLLYIPDCLVPLDLFVPGCEQFCKHVDMKIIYPISLYLFIVAAKLLVISIRGNINNKGIVINDRDITIIQLSEDISCFVARTESRTF